MKHFNGHMPAVIDVETTGEKAGFHDLIQVAVVPLDDNLEVSKTHRHFEMNIRPKYGNINPEATEVHKLDMIEIMKKGVDPDDSIVFFSQWYDRLDLPMNRRLFPIASNFVFDNSFMVDWLGQEMYNERFHFHYRDTQAVALYMNDRAGEMNEHYPFSAVGLPDLANHFGIENLHSHDALQDSITTAQTYKKMCSMFTYTYPREVRTLKEPTNKWYSINKFEKKGDAWIRELSDGKGIARVGEKWWICDKDKYIDLPDSLTPEDILRFFL